MTYSTAMSVARALHPGVLNSRAEIGSPEHDEVRKRNKIRSSLSDDEWPLKIAAFRKLYNLSRFNLPIPGPLSPERSALHRGLHAEEFGEAMGWSKERIKELVHEARDTTPELNLGDNLENVDFDLWAEQVDGRLDLIYTLLGELDEMGLKPVWVLMLMEEVHASNMTKVDNEGNPVYDEHGKVQKGDNYVKADIISLLHKFRQEAKHG